MTKDKIQLHRLRRDEKAVSPAISTVILTSAVVVLLLVTVTFANNFLNARMAENEFSATKQFMQTVGLQIDDVAWTIGRAQTIRYASRYGQVNFVNETLRYTVYVNDVFLANYSTGILLYNMPISQYSVSNNYSERIFPSSDSSFLQVGTSAPVSHVYVIEKLPMNDGNFIRVVVAPSIRMLNLTIPTVEGTKNYFRFFLPVLSSGSHPRYSQSVTLAGSRVSAETKDSVNNVKIHVSFLKDDLGFDEDFFNFESVDKEMGVPDGSIIFYTGEVIVSLGLYA